MTLSEKENVSTDSAPSVSFTLNLADKGTTYTTVDAATAPALPDKDSAALKFYDLVYRTVCAIMYNFTGSGHPGGSVSSGRIVETLLFSSMRYNFQDPNDKTADLICYTAGHKALGMYAMWACRDEVVRQAHPELLPADLQRLRLEDLLGFRKNPATETPLFRRFNSKPLDGHPTPETPFVWTSTGPSGVGVTAATGMALALKDLHGNHAPFVHLLEGEGGMTPGRVSEAVAAAASSGLNNLIAHIDWNQAAIDSNIVTREGERPGDYVQWDPREFFMTHGFNVINVEDGFDFNQTHHAQRLALRQKTQQPTAIVYRTTKGWRYGVEGKASHGAGHKYASEGYFEALAPFEKEFNLKFPRIGGEKTPAEIEQAYYDSLVVARKAFEDFSDKTQRLGAHIAQRAQDHAAAEHPYSTTPPQLEKLYDTALIAATEPPASLQFDAGSSQTLRGALATTLNEINKITDGAILAAAADVYGSTNTTNIGKGFGDGFFHAHKNPGSRIFSGGGITEDAISGICSGIATMGRHIAAGASYGAFMVPLSAIATRTHSIAQQTIRHRNPGEPFKTMIIVSGHAGVKTGEDGPTHAEVNTLQFFQDNHPDNTVITLTPWDPQELWPLTIAGLQARPAVLVPFVTRPNETVFDREALGLAPVNDCIKGVYKLLAAQGAPDGSIVLQGSDVANVFVADVLPLIREKGINLDVYYIASAELFNALDTKTRNEIYPDSVAQSAMMITGFSLPSTYRWITSARGRAHTLYPHQHGEYLGSGPGEMCLKQAGLDGPAQLAAIERFLKG
ncbi:MAG TPA: hypothetical protein VLB27_07895 [candidate division Zixibacteria bacterium]|nr:hypothetical protein [candidate division Zixibacteria bacterium]